MRCKVDERIWSIDLPDHDIPHLRKYFVGRRIKVIKGRKFPRGKEMTVNDLFFYEVYAGSLLIEVILYFVTSDGKVNSNNVIWE
jgi:hypothetical protein